MDMPPEALRRIAEDQVVWLTTVADSGTPAPNPVWFVPDGADLVVFTPPGSRKVHNIGLRPTVSLNFNSDELGGDIVVITGTASLTPNVLPSSNHPYVDKYSAAITSELRTTIGEIDRLYNTEVRITPSRVRLTPPA
ncbi:pyridoxamine 5'-phosphate oxidase family protein [Rhodococcus sp. NPDC003322]